MPSENRNAVVALCKSADIDIEKEIFACREEGASWISLEEAAKIVDLSKFTVRRWCKSGVVIWRKLNPARCGRIVILRSSLMAYIEHCVPREA